MVQKIHNTIENAVYGYVPGEFMPVWYDGQLDNRNEFIAYKAKRAARALGHATLTVAQAFVHAYGTAREAQQ